MPRCRRWIRPYVFSKGNTASYRSLGGNWGRIEKWDWSLPTHSATLFASPPFPPFSFLFPFPSFPTQFVLFASPLPFPHLAHGILCIGCPYYLLCIFPGLVFLLALSLYVKLCYCSFVAALPCLQAETARVWGAGTAWLWLFGEKEQPF